MKTKRLTKRDLLAHYGTDAEIARVFGIIRQAVHQWPIDAPIPRMRELELRHEIAPDIWGK